MRWVPILLLAIPNLAVTNGSNETTIETRRAQLSAALQQQWEYELRTHPEMATYIGDNRYNDRLSDHSAATYAQELEHAKQTLESIEAISTDGFPAQEQLNKLLMVRRLREHIEAYGFKDWEMPVDQFGGIHLSYAALPSATPFRSVKDYEDYLSRLHQIPRVFDEIRENMQLGLRDNLVPPRYLLEKVVVQAQDIADKSAHDSPFTQPVFKFPAGIPEAEQQRLHDATLAAVKNEVAPAYASFAAFVRTQYAPHGRADYGIWALPQGDARYRFGVRQMTTTDLGPEEIHQMGLKQVAEIENQMLALARRQGFSDLASFNAHIRQDRDLYGQSGQQILELYQHYTDQMYAKLPQLFGHLPKTKLEVIPMEAFRAPDSVPADYSPGSGDGSRPGRINVNEYDPQHRLLLNVEAIAYHEGIPGHHLQFSIAQQLPTLPPFRRFASYNAYSEGWAFYAERLGKEAGFYQDPYSEYGRLENEMWRSVRLVVDTGVHYKHWSRQQMVDFFRQHTAMDEPNIQTEVDRYIAWPGQALAYKLGQMKILELRERAQDALGDKFDLRAFHDAVLADGPLPLDVLESRINAWIGPKH
ncbi:conserved hypothetical protein [Acidobacteriia bacterium SbA2]|nr:conserved hypothetical protein [Acidobacteriia bacterium SbA2]